MKKLITTCILSVLFFLCNAQDSFPTKQFLGYTPNTLVDGYTFRAKNGIINGIYPDTATANLVLFFKNYNGATIYTTIGGLKTWGRYNNTWVLQSGGGSSNAWLLNGNAGALGSFLGTTDNAPLSIATNNQKRFTIPANGIQYSSNPNLMPLLIDTSGSSDGDLYFGNAGGGTDSIVVNYPLIGSNDTLSVDTTYLRDTALVTQYQLKRLALTGNLAYVDIVNGSDATGTLGNEGKPFLTLSAVKTAATSGYTIVVRPGSYTTAASLAKDSVDWFFYPGTTVTMSEEDDANGIWDDGGSAMRFNVWGKGKFIRSIADDRTDGKLVFISNVSSNVTIEASELIASGTDGDIETIRQENGNLIVKSDYITAIGSFSFATFWKNGSGFIQASKISAGNYGVWAEVFDTPTGDFHITADEITVTESSSAAVYSAGGNGEGAVWVNAQTIRGKVYGGDNKMYVTCQKIFGSIRIVDAAAAPAYITADKITDVGQGLIFTESDISSTLFLNVKQLDPSIYSGSMIIGNGELQITAADYLGTSSSTGLEINGGTVKLTNCNLNTSLNSGTSPIIKTGGSLLIQNTILTAHLSANGISAPTSQTVTSYGSVSNRPLDPDVVLTGNMTVNSLSYNTNIASGVGAKTLRYDPATAQITYGDTASSGSSSDIPVGDFLSTTFSGSSLPSDMTSSGATIAVSGGKMRISGTGYARGTSATASANWRDSSNFIFNTVPSDDNGGVYYGRLSANSTTSANLYVVVKRVSPTTCRLVLRLMNDNSTPVTVDSSSVITMTAGDNYRLIVSSSNTFAWAQIQHLVAGAETEVTSLLYKYNNTAPTAQKLVPNTGYPVIGVLGSGGVYDIEDFNEYHYDLLRSDITIVGTSITARYNSFSTSQYWVPLLFQNTNKTYSVLGGPGDRMIEMLLRIGEIRAIGSPNVILEVAPNDDCGDVRTNLTALIDSIQAGGQTPYVLTIVSTVCRDTVITNVCREQGVVLINPGQIMTSVDYQDGSVHPNGAGANKIANYIKGAVPYLFNRTGGTETTSLQDADDVYFYGVGDGDLVSYNNSTGLWNNKPLSSAIGGAYIKNQLTSQTGANFNIDGYGQLGAGLGISAAPVAGTPIHMYENVGGGQGIHSYNDNATSSSGTKYTSWGQFGAGGFSVPDWPNAAYWLSYANGGSVIGSYAGTIKFQTGSSFTTRGTWNSTGLSIGTTSAPAEALDVTGNIRFSGALMPNNTAGTSGQILTSAGAGAVPTWVTPVGSSVSGGMFYGRSATSSGAAAFTPDIALGDGSSYAGSLTLRKSSGSDVQLQAAPSGTSYIFFLPISMGSANQIMTTDGGNQSSWGYVNSTPSPYTAKTTTYSIAATDYTIDCTSGTFTVTLPTASGRTGKVYSIVNSGAGVITIATTSSQTFTNVALTPTTLTLSSVGTYMVQSTGANWVVLSTN